LIFASLLAIYFLVLGVGFIFGKLHWADYRQIQNSPLLRLTRNLEYKVPGYGDLIKNYKGWHDQQRDQLLAQKSFWGLSLLIFINNWIVANITMTIRALFLFPILLSLAGKFFQGLVFAQVASGPQIWIVFLTEFGGYFLVICATLCLSLWTIFKSRFGFPTRGTAVVTGLKLIVVAFVVSAIGMAIGSLVEANFILKIYGSINIG